MGRERQRVGVPLLSMLLLAIEHGGPGAAFPPIPVPGSFVAAPRTCLAARKFGRRSLGRSSSLLSLLCERQLSDEMPCLPDGRCFSPRLRRFASEFFPPSFNFLVRRLSSRPAPLEIETRTRVRPVVFCGFPRWYYLSASTPALPPPSTLLQPPRPPPGQALPSRRSFPKKSASSRVFFWVCGGGPEVLQRACVAPTTSFPFYRLAYRLHCRRILDCGDPGGEKPEEESSCCFLPRILPRRFSNAQSAEKRSSRELLDHVAARVDLPFSLRRPRSPL